LRKNSFAAGNPPWTPLGELTALPITPSSNWGKMRKKEGKWEKVEEKGASGLPPKQIPGYVYKRER